MTNKSNMNTTALQILNPDYSDSIKIIVEKNAANIENLPDDKKKLADYVFNICNTHDDIIDILKKFSNSTEYSDTLRKNVSKVLSQCGIKTKKDIDRRAIPYLDLLEIQNSEDRILVFISKYFESSRAREKFIMINLPANDKELVGSLVFAYNTYERYVTLLISIKSILDDLKKFKEIVTNVLHEQI